MREKCWYGSAGKIGRRSASSSKAQAGTPPEEEQVGVHDGDDDGGEDGGDDVVDWLLWLFDKYQLEIWN